MSQPSQDSFMMTAFCRTCMHPRFPWQWSIRTMLKLLAAVGVLAFLFSAASPYDDDIQPEFISSRTSAPSSVSKSRSRVGSSVAERRTHQATSQVAWSFPLKHIQSHAIISNQLWLKCASLNIAPAGTRAPPHSF
jgi:hypothetical protein